MNISSKILENGGGMPGHKSFFKKKKKRQGEGMRMGWRPGLVALFGTLDKPNSYISNFDQLFLFILRTQVDTQ